MVFKILKLIIVFIFAFLVEIEAGSKDILVVDNFKNYKLSEDGIPEGWELKEWKGNGKVLIEKDGSENVVHLVSEKSSFALFKDIKFDFKNYPYLNWKWKVTKLPKDGDARNKETDDQAAQIYVVFPRFPAFINSKMIGYIWDSNAPEGTFITSRKNSNIGYYVMKSGSKNLGRWFAEKRNVFEDYKKLFNEDPPKAGRIAIMIDSDDTEGSAESFFGEIYFSKD